MKNSSRLLEKIARKLARSSNGSESSSASSSTRWLNASQRELAVEEAVPGEFGVVDELRLGVVVVEQVGGDRRVTEGAVVHHPPIIPAPR